MKRYSIPASLAWAVVAVVGLATPAVAGDSVPFKGSLEGALTQRIPSPAPPVFLDRIETTGTATLLGQFEMVEIAVVDLGVVPPYAEGVAMFVAANGDTLTADFYGSSALVEPGIVLITEYATITEGTGRFAGASGGYTTKRLFNLVTHETIGYFEGTISAPGP
jgi:hypothetical protein